VWGAKSFGALFQGIFFSFRLYKSAGKKFSLQWRDKFSKAINMEFYAVLSHFEKMSRYTRKSAPRLPKLEVGGFSQFGQCPYLYHFFLKGLP